MKITLDISSGKANEILDSFVRDQGYKDTIVTKDFLTIPNPVTKIEFCKQAIIDYIKRSVIAYNANKASEEAKVTSIESSKTDLVIT